LDKEVTMSAGGFRVELGRGRTWSFSFEDIFRAGLAADEEYTKQKEE